MFTRILAVVTLAALASALPKTRATETHTVSFVNK
jgi:hypothetical protein